MKKKGYTLIEMVLVIAIMAILLGVVYMNMIKIISQSKVQSFADQTVALIKESYENSNKEMDFSSWKIEIDNHSTDTKNLTITLKKANNTINEIQSRKIQIEKFQGNIKGVPPENLSLGTNYIQFQKLGDLKTLDSENHKDKDKNTYIYYDSCTFELHNVDNPDYKKTIEINSIPPGSISVK